MNDAKSVLLCTDRESGTCRFQRPCDGKCQIDERRDQTGDYRDLMWPTVHIGTEDENGNFVELSTWDIG